MPENSAVMMCSLKAHIISYLMLTKILVSFKISGQTFHSQPALAKHGHNRSRIIKPVGTYVNREVLGRRLDLAVDGQQSRHVLEREARDLDDGVGPQHQVAREALEGPALGRHGARRQRVARRRVHPQHRQPQDAVLLRLDLVQLRALGRDHLPACRHRHVRYTHVDMVLVNPTLLILD